MFAMKEIEVDDSVGTQVFHNDNVVIILEIDYDSDAPHPLNDCDGMGNITSFNRRHRDCVKSPEEAEALLKKKYAVALSYFEHGNCLWGVQGTLNGTPDFKWDGCSLAGVWLPDDCCIEHIKSSALKHCFPDNIKVEVNYESHDGKLNDIVLRISKIVGENAFEFLYRKEGFKSFTAAYKHGLKYLAITPTKDQVELGERKVAVECAEQACELYTAWCNGDCYGYSLKAYRPCTDEDDEVIVDADAYEDQDEIEEDSCWGFVGSENLKYMIEDNVKPFIKKHLEMTAEVNVADELAKLV